MMTIKNRLLVAMASTLLMAGVAAPASATAYVFNTTGNTPDNGAYGNSLAFTSTAGNAHVTVSGYQANQSNNAITSAYVGAYSPGTGVTGVNDFNGNYGYHQIDNALGYTDFALLTFDRAVTLSSIGLNSFTLGNATTKDNDLAFLALTSPFNAATFSLTPGNWTTINGTGLDGVVSTGSSAVSNQWLVGAAFNSGGNDGFKIASLTTSSAVPEPATWAMMLVGFGAAGVSLRRRPSRRVALQAA